MGNWKFKVNCYYVIVSMILLLKWNYFKKKKKKQLRCIIDINNKLIISRYNNNYNTIINLPIITKGKILQIILAKTQLNHSLRIIIESGGLHY